MISKFLSFVWRIWFVFLAILTTLIIGGLLILPFSFRDKDYPIAYFFSRIWAFVLLFGTGIFYKLYKKTDKPFRQPSIIIANHTSMMDIMLMYAIHKKPMLFVGKKELVKLPVFGAIYKRNNILVDRDDEKSRMKVLRQCMAKLKEDYSICIFPEGGVPDESIFLDEFKDGPFVTAALGNVDLAIYTFCGMKERLPYAFFRGGPGKVNAFLNDIVEKGTFSRKQTEEFKDYARSVIVEQLTECTQKNK